MINYLEQKGAITVLMYLLEHEEGYIIELKKLENVGQAALYTALYNLQNLELINEGRGTFNKRIFRLTNKGKKVALKLKEIEEILQEQ